MRGRVGTDGRRLPGEAGLALPEILVAMLILALGSLAVLGSFDAASRNTYRAEQNQVAINIGQREMEKIRQLPYADVALTATPANSADPNDPRNRVNGSYFAVNRDGTGLAEMAVKGIGGQETGTVSPGPTPFTSGDVSGRIFRYVTWQDDPGCGAGCAGTHDYKRVIVIVHLDDEAVSSATAYDEVHSNFTDPDDAAPGETPPSGGAVTTAQQFFLSDTPCSQATRQEITSDHAHHDTLGSNCSAANPSDTLFLDAPPDPDPESASIPSQFDYATDAALEPTPAGADAGLQLLRQSANGCTYSGAAVTNTRIHRWVSEPMPLNFVMSGDATLELHTRTINDAVADGAICIFLFRRSAAGVDTLLVDLSNPPNQYFRHSAAPWPRGTWTRMRIPLRFPQTTALSGSRVGVAIAVRRDGSSGDVLEFMYDHPDHPSRLEIKTTTPIP